jgi:hypothetical protein
MSYASEYNNQLVNGGSCSYTNLSTYNNGMQGNMLASSGSTSDVKVVVPSWGGVPGYNTLSGKVPTCTGYASLYTAYSNKTADPLCNSYSTRLCQ